MSRASKEERRRKEKWGFEFLSLGKHQDSLTSLPNMQIRVPPSQIFGFIIFVAQESPFSTCQVSVMQGSQEHMLRNTRTLVSREQGLSRACCFLRKSRSAPSCLLSAPWLPGGGSASRWGPLVSAAPWPPHRASSCANLRPSCLRDFPARVPRAPLLRSTCCAPELDAGPLCQALPESCRFPRRSDSAMVDYQRTGRQHLFFGQMGTELCMEEGGGGKVGGSRLCSQAGLFQTPVLLLLPPTWSFGYVTSGPPASWGLFVYTETIPAELL